jgi:hypothetical protein
MSNVVNPGLGASALMEKRNRRPSEGKVKVCQDAISTLETWIEGRSLTRCLLQGIYINPQCMRYVSIARIKMCNAASLLGVLLVT